MHSSLVSYNLLCVALKTYIYIYKSDGSSSRPITKMISLESCAFFALSFIIPLVYGDDEKLLTHYVHPDVDAERNAERVVGIVVGVSLASVFLVILCITYNYYKHKPYRNVPRDVEEPLTAMK